MFSTRVVRKKELEKIPETHLKITWGYHLQTAQVLRDFFFVFWLAASIFHERKLKINFISLGGRKKTNGRVGTDDVAWYGAYTFFGGDFKTFIHFDFFVI